MNQLALFNVAGNPTHPARFNDTILRIIDRLLGDAVTVLDPFAGTGGIHRLNRQTTGIEIEPEWAALHPATLEGDALQLPFPNDTFDAIATSPTYGNRMADTYDGRDGSDRSTYTTALGHPLTAGNTGALQWGDEYRDLHRQAWTEAHRVLKPAGRFVLNTSDHIRRGRLEPVTEWHHRTLEDIGLTLIEVVPVPTARYRHGANHQLRADFETVARFKKGDR